VKAKKLYCWSQNHRTINFICAHFLLFFSWSFLELGVVKSFVLQCYSVGFYCKICNFVKLNIVRDLILFVNFIVRQLVSLWNNYFYSLMCLYSSVVCFWLVFNCSLSGNCASVGSWSARWETMYLFCRYSSIRDCLSSFLKQAWKTSRGSVLSLVFFSGINHYTC